MYLTLSSIDALTLFFSFFCECKIVYLLMKDNIRRYIHVISRVRSRYVKLWAEFFSFLLWPKRGAREPWKQGRKKRGSITCGTDRANEASKMFIILLCWLFRFWKKWSRARSPYGYLRTWNWPITAREISQPYNKSCYCSSFSVCV